MKLEDDKDKTVIVVIATSEACSSHLNLIQEMLNQTAKADKYKSRSALNVFLLSS